MAAKTQVKKEKQSLAHRFKQRLKHGYFVRFHMSLILAAVIASGVSTSKLLLMAGFHNLPVRYALAVLSSYLVFFGLVRLWVWYVSVSHWGSPDLSLADVPDLSGGGGFGGGGGSGFPGFGGGDSGGGGASAAWVEGPATADVGTSSGGSGSSFSLPSLDLDLGDDGWWIILLLAIFIIIIICAGGYLIWMAPDILPEAAWQVALASGINRVVKGKDPSTWFVGIMRASAIPMLLILAAAIALGWGAHKVCPQATKLAEAVRCVAESNEVSDPP